MHPAFLWKGDQDDLPQHLFKWEHFCFFCCGLDLPFSPFPRVQKGDQKVIVPHLQSWAFCELLHEWAHPPQIAWSRGRSWCHRGQIYSQWSYPTNIQLTMFGREKCTPECLPHVLLLLTASTRALLVLLLCCLTRMESVLRHQEVLFCSWCCASSAQCITTDCAPAGTLEIVLLIPTSSHLTILITFSNSGTMV